MSTAAPATAFDRPNTTADGLGNLQAAFKHQADGSGVFESGSDPVIVGQAPYNDAYFAAGDAGRFSATAPLDGMARIADFSMTFKTLLGTNLTIPFENKGIHDEMNSAHFDEFGRMTANMGLEAPGATPLLQNIILYPFVNPSTENLDGSLLSDMAFDVLPIASAADGTQIWKITHNGVDTHPLHFHLYNVQLLNRVTWDNIVIPPEPSELGWKETIRVSPLEDTIVAVRPIIPALPFGVPDSTRPYNPMMPIGARGSAGRPQRDRSRLQQRRSRRQPDRTDHQPGRLLRLGIRVALPHPQPRRDGHDASADRVRAHPAAERSGGTGGRHCGWRP